MKNYFFLFTLFICAVSVSYSQVCPSPQNLIVSNVQSNTVTVSWDIQDFDEMAADEEVITSYGLGLRLSSGSWSWYELGILPFENSIIVEGLSPLTQYEVRMESQCSSNSSEYSQVVSFTTTEEVILGCTDADACNYNADATQDDNSCSFPTFVDDTVTICESSYEWINGLTYTESTTVPYPTFFVENTDGTCSTKTLILTLNSSTTSSEDTTVCESYQWNGETYFSTGIYTYSTINALGCDSIVTLNLSVNNSLPTLESISACGSYEWNGETYTESGTYFFETNNSIGCDSIAILELSISYTATSSEDTIVCESYEWNGETYTESGIYTFENNVSGCNTIATLYLTITNPTIATEDTSVCESYEWNGETYTTSGIYTYDTINAAGCDSTITLNLTVNNSSTSEEEMSACESYEWNGTTYSESGTYTYTAINSVGCDSVATLYLSIDNSTSSNEVTSCESYDWNGETYSESGTYTFETTNSVGCDSIAFLNLSILSPPTPSTNEVTACGSYEWNNSVYTQSGTYEFDTIVGVGCDSLAILILTVLPSFDSTINVNSCISYEWRDSVYMQSGTYSFDTLNINGCDSTVTLNLTLYYPSENTIDTILCPGETLTVGSNTYSTAGEYSDTLVDMYGCDSIVSTNLIFSDFEEINISGNESVEINETATYSITNTNGSLYNWSVSSGGLIADGQESNEITVEFVSVGQTTITVIETNTDGCISEAVTLAVNVEETVSSGDYQPFFDLQVYPNPFTSQATVTFNNPNANTYRLEIVDSRGRVIRVYDSITSNSLVIKKEQLINGIYYLNFIGSDTVINSILMVK